MRTSSLVLLPFLSHWTPGAELAEQQRIDALETDDYFDFSRIPEAAETEFLLQAELSLQSTIQIAIAADARATTLTGTLAAASAALYVLAGNIALKDTVRLDALAPVLVAAVLLSLAAICCNLAGRPVEFCTAGYNPGVLYEAAASDRKIKLETASDIQRRLERNYWCLAKGAQILTLGRWTTVATPMPR